MPKRDRTIFAPSMPTWKVRAMIEKLGGVGPTTEKLIAKGFFPPGPDTVQGWSTRNSMPGAWAPAVFALAIDEGIIKHPLEALMRDTEL